ncbi:MAG TPA: hypothetical protein VGE02_04665 [Gemmatimonadales bacterium]
MGTIASVTTPRRPLVTTYMATPPPTPRLDMADGDTAIGWIDGMAIGFCGFHDEAEAAHAAWVAYRTMSRRFARGGGHRMPPIDIESVSLDRSGEVEMILAGGRPIATLVRPGADSRSGPDSFGFELQAPTPADELTMRSTAYLVYRTLRRSGIRWAMWTPAPSIEVATDGPGATGTVPADVMPTRAPQGAAGSAPADTGRRDGASHVLPTALVVLAVLSLMALPAISGSNLVVLLGGAAALVAVAALTGLTHMVVTDVRDMLRWRKRTDGPTQLDDRRPPVVVPWARRVPSIGPRHPRRALTTNDAIPGTS